MADIEYKTPEDVAEEKARKKAGKAYDAAMPEPDTTTGKLGSDKKDRKPEPTKARKMANEMELERTYPMSSKMAKETPTQAQSGSDAIKAGLGIPLAMGVDMVTGPKRRSEEDMSELTREVARGNKMARGGMASSASRRADGIATKGKTRGKIC
jgi:hypothetical protein